MTRAAGYKAYAMVAANRDRNLFMPSYLSFSQLNDVVAIVNVGGKEQYFDPGQRLCGYGHMAWKHSMAEGLRQSDAGAVIGSTPSEAYAVSRIQRVANLTMNDHGEVTGRVKITFVGAPALSWRQRSLRGDTTSLQDELRRDAERQLPGGMEIKVSAIGNVEEYDKPLIVAYDVKGAIGSGTGKRLLVPSDLLEANTRPTFPHEKRQLPVCFNYPDMVQDAVRINFPASLALESVPASETVPFEKFCRLPVQDGVDADQHHGPP